MKRFIILLAIVAFAGCSTMDLSKTAGPPSAPSVWKKSGNSVTPSKTTWGVKLNRSTVANLPTLASGDAGALWQITDGADSEDCTTGSGSTTVICRWTGSAWTNAGDGGVSSSVEDDAYGSGWNADTTHAPSQNAMYDQIHLYDTDDDGDIDNIDGAVGGGDITGVGPGGTGAGDALTDGYLTSGTTLFIWEGTTSDANQVNFVMPEADPSAATTLTFPDQTGTFLLGPAAGLTDNTIPRSNGSTSHLLQASGITIDDSDNLANVGTISSGAITSTGTSTFGTAASPDAADGATLGSATAEWSDLFLADGGVIYGQSDQSNSITSSATDWTFALDVVVTGSDLTLGAAGVKLTGDGDGAITFLGLGDGADEDLTINLDDTANTAVISSSTGVTGITFTSIGLTTGAASDLSAGAVTVGTLSGTITMASATDVTYKDGTVDPADLADGDFGDFSVSSGSATLDADVVAAAEMADADHGDVSWTSGVAAVEDLTITSEAQGDILYFNGSNWVRLAPGVSGQYLQTQGAAANPQWASTGVSGDIEDVGDASSGAAFTADGAGNTLYFEGSTANAFEVILTADDATADVTATLTLDTGNIIIGASDFTTDTALVRVDRDSAEYASIEETGILVDASNNMSAVGTLGITGDLTIATADPDIVLDDTDGADGLIQIAATDADDSVMTLAVDDSGGDDQGYIELDGVNETVDVLQNATFAGTVEITGTLTVNGASATLPATSFGDANITNVGSLALDSIIADGSAIALGGGTETLAIDTSDWDISTTGAITGVAFDANGTGNTLTNINAADHADEDWGDISVASGSFTLDADVVAAAEMADADHGDVAWSSGVATVEHFAISSESTVADDIGIRFGGAATDWYAEFDDSVDDQMLWHTTATSAITTTDPMFEILVDYGTANGTGMTSDQEVFGVAKGTQASNVALLTLDENGDLEIAGTFTSNASGDSYLQLNNNSGGLAASGYRVYFETDGSDVISYSLNGSEKRFANLEDAQTFSGAKTFSSAVNLNRGATGSGQLVIYEDSDNGTNTLTITSPAALTASYTMTFPDGGSINKYLYDTDGNGTLGWGTPSAAANTDGGAGAVQFNTGGALDSDASFVYTEASYTLTIGESNGSSLDGKLAFFNEGGTDYTATLQPGTQSSNATITLPGSTSTLATLGLAETFSALKTFTAGMDIDEDVDIDFDANDEEVNIASSATDYAADSAMVTIINSGAGQTNAHYLLRLRHTADGDAQDHFLVAEDNNGDDMFKVDSGGVGTFAGAVTSGGTITSSGLFDVTGATGLDLGSADVTDITLLGQSEDLALTPSADTWTVSSSTGVTDISFSAINISTTGVIKGRASYGADITGAIGHNTTATHGVFYHFTAAATVTLDAAADAGYGAQVCYRVRDAAEAAVIDVDAAEKINLAGTALAAGTAITATGAGESVCMVATTDTDGSGTDGWEAWGATSGWASE